LRNRSKIALAQYFCRDYEVTVAAVERAIRSFPDFPSPYRWRAAALGQLGRIDDARASLAYAMAISAEESAFQVRDRRSWFRPQGHAHMLSPPVSARPPVRSLQSHRPPVAVAQNRLA
jgi:tetratricopeptide (TPR) repeat protein